MSFVEDGTIYSMKYDASKETVQSLSMIRYGQEITNPSVIKEVAACFQKWARRRGVALILELKANEHIKVPFENLKPQSSTANESMSPGIEVDDAELASIVLKLLQKGESTAGELIENIQSQDISVSHSQAAATVDIVDAFKSPEKSLDFNRCMEILKEAAEVEERPSLKPKDRPPKIEGLLNQPRPRVK
tara:strand:+ start:7044 stop:7613 length:570 start_codon:yes stop_codon:yes gene_type:complete